MVSSWVTIAGIVAVSAASIVAGYMIGRHVALSQVQRLTRKMIDELDNWLAAGDTDGQPHKSDAHTTEE